MFHDPIRPILDHQGILILDGGLATELESRGSDLGDELWSARILLEDPELLNTVHDAYLAAGADSLISASYQATIPGFRRRGLSEDEARSLLRSSVEVARQSRDRFWSQPQNRQGRRRPLVASSVGPYGAFLADGSEYRGRYGLHQDELLRFHRDRWHALVEGGPDLMALETLPDRDEVLALAELARETPEMPIWISLSCPDGEHLADGSELAPLVRHLEAHPQVVALGVNCLAPSLVESILGVLARHTSKPLLAYPNSGEGWDAQARQWTASPESSSLASAAERWVQAGARILGGCCRTTPADIRALRSSVLGSLG